MRQTEHKDYEAAFDLTMGKESRFNVVGKIIILPAILFLFLAVWIADRPLFSKE